jgi:hypothetical protein
LAPLVWTLLRRRADGAPGDQDRHLELAGPEPATGPEPISLDPLLLARFVAHGGHEEEHA